MSSLDRLLSKINLKSVVDEEFVESEHPRAPDGKFTSGAGSAKKMPESHHQRIARLNAMPWSERNAYLENHYRDRRAIIDRTAERIANAVKIPNRAGLSENRSTNYLYPESGRFGRTHQFSSVAVAIRNFPAVKAAYERTAQLVGGTVSVDRPHDRPSQIRVDFRLPYYPVNTQRVTPITPTAAATPPMVAETPPKVAPTAAKVVSTPEIEPANLEIEPIKFSLHKREKVGYLAKPESERLSSKSSDECKLALEDDDVYFSGFSTNYKALCKDFENITNGIDPLQYKEYLLGGLKELPGGVKKATMSVTFRSRELLITLEIKTQDAVIRLERSFEGGRVTHNLQIIKSRIPISVPDAKVQGGGKCAALFVRSLDLYDHMGIKKVSVHANIDVGGYAWARYGFVPTQNSWDSLKRQIPLLTKFFELDAPTRSAVKKILKNSDPKAIRQLAAIKTKIGDKTIGQLLLAGSDWVGEIDLENEDNYSLTREYTGRSRQ